MFTPRKTHRLCLGRISAPGAIYFVTTSTARRRPLFADPTSARTAVEAMQTLVADDDASWLAGTVMPDHLHLLFALGKRLTLDRVMAKLKGKVARELRPAHGVGIWQENAFEHRLRADESAEPYALYVFMNPYRARLCAMETHWPWWVCTDPVRFTFLSRRRVNGSPQIEWLRQSAEASSQIVTRSRPIPT